MSASPVSFWTLLGRLAIAAALLWAAWRYAMPADERPEPSAPLEEARQDVARQPELEAPLFLLSDLMNGRWRFADMPWETAWRTPAFSDDELATPPAVRRGDLQPREVESRIIRLAQSLAPAAEDAAPFILYRGELGGARFALFTSRHEGVELVEEVRVNYQQQGAAGAYVLRPSDLQTRQVDIRQSLRQAPQLPDDASILATRQNDAGEALGVILETQAALPELAQQWRAAGWRVEASPAIPATEALICEKAGAAWSAWRMQTPDGAATLLLIRIPDRT